MTECWLSVAADTLSSPAVTPLSSTVGFNPLLLSLVVFLSGLLLSGHTLILSGQLLLLSGQLLVLFQ